MVSLLLTPLLLYVGCIIETQFIETQWVFSRIYFFC